MENVNLQDKQSFYQEYILLFNFFFQFRTKYDQVKYFYFN